MVVRRRAVIGKAVTQSGRFVIFPKPGVDRVRHPVLLAAAEMVHQQIAGQRSEPGGESAFVHVIAGQRAIDAYKHVLGQVLGVVRRVGKPVAEVINTPLMQAQNPLPGHGIASQAFTDQSSCLMVFQAVSPTPLRRSAYTRLRVSLSMLNNNTLTVSDLFPGSTLVETPRGLWMLTRPRRMIPGPR